MKTSVDSVIYYGGTDHETMWSVPISDMGDWFHQAVEEGVLYLDETNERLFLGGYPLSPGFAMTCETRTVLEDVLDDAIVEHTIVLTNSECLSEYRVIFQSEV